MMIALHLSAFMCFQVPYSLISSVLFVWIEHESDFGTHGSWWQVSFEVNSDGSVVTVSVDNSSPMNSEFGVVDGVLASEDISASSSEVEFSSCFISAVFDLNEGFILMLSSLSSSESSEKTVLVESNWLCFVVSFSSLCHLLFL